MHFKTQNELAKKGTVRVRNQIYWMNWHPHAEPDKLTYCSAIPEAGWVEATKLEVEPPPHIRELYKEVSALYEPITIEHGDIQKTYTPHIIHINMQRDHDDMRITYNVAWYEDENTIVHGESHNIDIDDEWKSNHINHLAKVESTVPAHLNHSHIAD